MSVNDAHSISEVARLLVENRELRREVRYLRQFIDSMHNVLEAVEQPRPDAEIMGLLGQVLEICMQAMDATDGSLLVLDEDTEELVFVITRGALPQERLAWRRLPAGEGIAGWVATHRRATITNDARADDRFYRELDQELGFETRSILAAPLAGGGRVLGVIEVLNKNGGAGFSTGDQSLLLLMCRFAGELLHTLVQRNMPLTRTRPAAEPH